MGGVRIMAKAKTNKERAIEYILKNRKTMTLNQVAAEASEIFGYSKSTITKWASHEYELESKKDKLTLRQKLELAEKMDQEKYERKLEAKVKNRPKFRFEL